MRPRRGFERPDETTARNEMTERQEEVKEDPPISVIGNWAMFRPTNVTGGGRAAIFLPNTPTSAGALQESDRGSDSNVTGDTSTSSASTDSSRSSSSYATIGPGIPTIHNEPIQRTTSSEDRNPLNRIRRCSKKNACLGIVTIGLLAIVATVVLYYNLKPKADEGCQFFQNEITCPYKSEYTEIDILSPPVQLENGRGRSSYDLKEDTDITVDGFNIRVRNQEITIRKQPSHCAEEGDYPIIFGSGTSSQHVVKLPLKVKDFSDIMQMEISPFTNTTDNKDYVELVCSGYHKCGTVVVDLQLQIPDFGIYNTPMDCSRITSDGKVIDNYGFECILIMELEMFQRTENLTCKPTVETLQNAETTTISQQSVDVNETTRSHFILERGRNKTIVWNTDLGTLKNFSHIQTKHNGVFRVNEFEPDARVKISSNAKGSIATFEVQFRPGTCVDEGRWELHLLNGDKSSKEIQVNGLSTFTDCPSLARVSVGDRLELKFKYCVPDIIRTYALNLYGITSRSGSFLEDKPITVVHETTSFQGLMQLNEFSGVIKKDPITCGDHMTRFMMSLETTGGVTVQNITSVTNVRAGNSRYNNYSTGGDFRENTLAVISLRLHLGCRPQNLNIYINGTLLTSEYSLTEDRSTGEKIFSKTFSFPKIMMHDDGTRVSLHSIFIDDDGSPRSLNITQVIRVIPDTFCQEKPHGCNYHHPYNNNMWVACGEGVIAELRTCQPGLVFVQTNCVGKCCPEGSTNNCG